MQVIAVVALAGTGADDVEMLVGEPGDRELGADAAASGQRVGERDAALLHRHLVRDERVEPCRGARARHLVLRERREVDHAHGIAHPVAFVADVLEIVAAPEAPDVLAGDPRRREPVGALPAIALPPDGAHLVQLRVDGARLGGTCVVALLVGIVDREDVAIGLLVLPDGVALARVRAEPARVDRQHVDAGLAFDDPFGELPARAARGRNAEAVAFVEPQVRHTPRRTDERAAVRRVGDRAVDDRLDAGVLEARHALHRRLDVRQQAVEVAREELLAELARNAIGEARRRALLVWAQDPAEALLAQVVRRVRLAQHGELAAARGAIGLQLRGLVVDDVLVLDRDRRHVEAELPAGLARIVAGRADDVLADDVALVRRDLPFARRRAGDAQRLGLFADLRAARARAAPQRHREIDRRDVAVVRMVERADDLRRVDAVAQVHERPQLGHFLRTDDPERHADRVRGAAVLVILVHPVARRREAQVAGDVEADFLPGLLRQALVEVDRILVQLADRVAHVEERQEPGGVPRRSRRELRALEQHHVGPALLRQMVERADADDSAADHHHPRMGLHVLCSLMSGAGRAENGKCS